MASVESDPFISNRFLSESECTTVIAYRFVESIVWLAVCVITNLKMEERGFMRDSILRNAVPTANARYTSAPCMGWGIRGGSIDRPSRWAAEVRDRVLYTCMGLVYMQSSWHCGTRTSCSVLVYWE
jgi:hypothetical protein